MPGSSQRERRLPARPYRDSAIMNAVLSGAIVGFAWLTGGDIARAITFAAIAFSGATAWSWWRWRERLAQVKRRGQ